jgi:hypothetical protein
MGTPHRGSRTADIAAHIAKIVNTSLFGGALRSDLFESLRLASPVLNTISEQSRPLLRHLQIVSFYEQKALGASLVSNAMLILLKAPDSDRLWNLSLLLLTYQMNK